MWFTYCRIVFQLPSHRTSVSCHTSVYSSLSGTSRQHNAELEELKSVINTSNLDVVHLLSDHISVAVASYFSSVAVAASYFSCRRIVLQLSCHSSVYSSLSGASRQHNAELEELKSMINTSNPDVVHLPLPRRIVFQLPSQRTSVAFSFTVVR